MRTHIQFFEKLGNVEGMEALVGRLEDVSKLLFLVFGFDAGEQGCQVALEGQVFEDKKLFEVVEQDTGPIGQSDG